MFQQHKRTYSLEIMNTTGKWVIILVCSLFSISKTVAQVGISSSNITPDASSILELRSTNAGFLPPRMTTAQRDSIMTPALGLVIYNSSTSQLNYYTGSAWQLVTGGTGEITTPTNGAANLTYKDNSSYWGYATTINGFPVNGTLSGVRKGIINTQYLQSEASSKTYIRYWNNITSAWSSWLLYVDSQDFTAKGALLAGTGVNTFAVITPGTNGTALFADNTAATGLKWALAENIIELGTDVINNNATANTIQDVTGLSFTVTAGVTYRFSALIIYTSAATTTGSRWSVNGPAAPTLLSYKSYYNTNATTEVNNMLTAYDMPVASNTASTSTAGNIATIDGIIKPSVNGTVTVRFASEIANSAITAKAGSTIKWW